MELCYVGGEEFQNNEEWDDVDGCYRWRCNEGAQEVVEDNTITVPGDLVLDTQAAVDDQTCLVGVDGNLTITGGVVDTTPITRLYRVGADLIVDASDVQNLSVLTITEVGGSIIISNNAQLTGMAFQPYMSIFGDATIQNNDALTSLAGAGFLGQCTACGSGAPPDDREPEPGGDSGDGLAEEPGGQFYGGITIADNDVLTDISVMSGLIVAWDDLIFRNNASLSGFPNMQLNEVQGNLEISNHAALDTLLIDEFVAGVNVLGTTLICGNLGGTPCP